MRTMWCSAVFALAILERGMWSATLLLQQLNMEGDYLPEGDLVAVQDSRADGDHHAVVLLESIGELRGADRDTFG